MNGGNNPWYHSAKWRHLREVILRRDGYQCQLSKRYGKRVQASTVHHIFPREQYPEYQWMAWNLISLSASAHDKLHDRTTDELTPEGVDLLRRTARKYDIPLPLRYEE